MLQQIVAQWRENALSALTTLFGQTLDKATSILLDQSDKARSSDAQMAFFQAHQELQRHRKEVLHRFVEHLGKRMAQPPAPKITAGHGKVDPELQLVNADQFERHVDLQNLTDHAEQKHYTLLHALAHRLSVVHRGAPVHMSNIPASPSQLVESFDVAIQLLAIERIARQALAILFDHSVLRHVEPYYTALNDQLRDAGVLPNLKYQVVVQPKGSTRRPAAAKPSPQAGSATAPVVPATPQPQESDPGLQQIRDMMPGTRASQGGDPATKLAATDVANMIQASQQALGELLPDHGVFDTAPGELQISAKQLEFTQHALRQQRLAIKDEIGPGRLTRYDESTIDIVGNLFERMLDEADLPASLKALLSHLHTPYLKLALREPELLSIPDHPARKLLDDMIDAGERWGHKADLGKGVFPVLQEIVNNLRHVDTLHHGLIDAQQQLLEQEVAELGKRHDWRSNRTTEAEAGRATLEHARELADNFVQLLLDDSQPCQPCQEFLTGPWTDYLTLLLLRNDCRPGGEQWQKSQEMGKHLAGVSQAVTGPEPPSREELLTLKQQLTDTLAELAPHYQHNIDSLMQGMLELRDQDRSTVQQLQPAPKPTPRARKRQDEEPIIDPPLNEAESTLLVELRNTPTGTVFRLPGNEGKPPQLVTMTWYNSYTDRLLFVDQNGAKSNLMPAALLARLLHEGLAMRIDEDRPPFFTRAMSALRQYLEKSGLIKQGANNG